MSEPTPEETLFLIAQAWRPSSRCNKWFRPGNVEISFKDACTIADALRAYAKGIEKRLRTP